MLCSGPFLNRHLVNVYCRSFDMIHKKCTTAMVSGLQGHINSNLLCWAVGWFCCAGLNKGDTPLVFSVVHVAFSTNIWCKPSWPDSKLTECYHPIDGNSTALKLTSVHFHIHISANRGVFYGPLEILDVKVTAVSWRWMDPCIHSRPQECWRQRTVDILRDKFPEMSFSLSHWRPSSERVYALSQKVKVSGNNSSLTNEQWQQFTHTHTLTDTHSLMTLHSLCTALLKAYS